MSDLKRCVECGALGEQGFVMEIGDWVCPACFNAPDELAQLRNERDTLKAKCDRLTDELATGNRLYAALTDRQNDAAVLLDSANQTINRLRGELTEAKRELIRTDRILQLEQLAHIETNKELQASEAARQEAVRERDLANESLRDWQRQAGELSSRLAQAEAALRSALGCGQIVGNSKARCLAALSGEEKK